MPAINFSLKLPPQKAIEWLEKKGVTVKNYREMTDSELAKSMTIARISDLDMLQSIKNALTESAKNGVPYAQFKRDVLQHMQAAGWLHKGESEKLEIIDPETGEVFGSPRRLENIYRTNMQSAFMAGQYQSYMDNVDNRPYWEYKAVGDARTRPMHLAMSGLIYRFDDPFWATFYPPNGYKCRCSVIALAERDIKRRNLVISDSSERNFIDVEKINKAGVYKTKAYKAPDGTLITADKGFNYNAGRMNYKPDLDLYDRKLAHEFAKSDMTGAEFKSNLKQLYEEFNTIKKRHGIEDKINHSDKLMVRNTLSRNLKFAAGVLSDENQKLIQCQRACVWLSDDTLIKQVDSRAGQNFDQFYADLPDVINQPDQIFTEGDNKFILMRRKENQLLMTVIKYLQKPNELFVQSYRLANDKELIKFTKKSKVLK